MSRAPHRLSFTRFAGSASHIAGRPVAFGTAVLVVLLWAVSGPLFDFSDAWQLAINTGTTIVTFLMVFLIQSTQNRDSYALQIKLDELIRAMAGAHDALLDLEELDDAQLDRIRARYRSLARQARMDLARGRTDTGIQEVGHSSATCALTQSSPPLVQKCPGAGGRHVRPRNAKKSR
jgi:low affinity Fe/Cu permease